VGFDYEQNELEKEVWGGQIKKKYNYFCLSEHWVNHLESSVRKYEPGTCTTMNLKL